MKKTIFKNYIISSNGIVYNKKTNKEISSHVSNVNRSTRVRIHLTISKGIRKMFYLHKLIVETFIENYNDRTDDIVFIDGDITNCSLDNLKIVKNAHIIDKPNKETNDFFNNQNVYGMIGHYLKKNKKHIDLKNAFQYDDLIQYLITYVHRKTPIYLKEYKTKQAYSTFVYKLLDTLFKSQIYKIVNSYSSIIRLKDNTFDYEINPIFINSRQAYELDIFRSKH